MTHPDFDLRFTYVTDLPYLKEWLQSPGMLHWFPMQEEKEVDDAAQCWVGFSRYSCSLTGVIGEEPCAMGTLFLMPYRKLAHHCLIKIIVAPKWQRQGIGSSLLKNLKHLAKTQFRQELVHMEVFEGNPMIELLKKFDFHEFARQEKFVKENGIYYTRILLESYL